MQLSIFNYFSNFYFQAEWWKYNLKTWKPFSLRRFHHFRKKIDFKRKLHTVKTQKQKAEACSVGCVSGSDQQKKAHHASISVSCRRFWEHQRPSRVGGYLLWSRYSRNLCPVVDEVTKVYIFLQGYLKKHSQVLSAKNKMKRHLSKSKNCARFKWKAGCVTIQCFYSVWESMRQSGLEREITLTAIALNSTTTPVPNIQLNVTLHCTIY